MRDHPLEVSTEEQRERLHTARRRGGLCAACGRALGEDEPVFIERFVTGVSRHAEATGWPHTVYTAAPVGRECASARALSDARWQAPKPCAGCGRGVYYVLRPSRARRALCSRGCAARAGATGEAGDCRASGTVGR